MDYSMFWLRKAGPGALLIPRPRDTNHLGYTAQSALDARQMLAIDDLQRKVHIRVGTAVVVHADAVDVGAVRGNRPRHLGEHAALVHHRHVDADIEQACGLRSPFHVQPLVRIGARFGRGRTVVRVDHDALAFLDGTDDRVARYRPATLGELYRHAFGTADDDRPGVNLRRRLLRCGQQLSRHHGGETLAQADVGKQLQTRLGGNVAQELVPLLAADLRQIRIQRA